MQRNTKNRTKKEANTGQGHGAEQHHTRWTGEMRPAPITKIPEDSWTSVALGSWAVNTAQNMITTTAFNRCAKTQPRVAAVSNPSMTACVKIHEP